MGYINGEFAVFSVDCQKIHFFGEKIYCSMLVEERSVEESARLSKSESPCVSVTQQKQTNTLLMITPRDRYRHTLFHFPFPLVLSVSSPSFDTIKSHEYE